MRKILLFALLLSVVQGSFAQTCADYVVQINATVQASPPQIALSWPAVAGSSSCLVFRKAKNSINWGSAIATLAGTATGYTDNTVASDSAYEYAVQLLGNPAYGYIYAGIKAPAIHYRGTLLLLVDSTFTDSCSAEITRLMQDISHDGWRVMRKDFLRTTSHIAVKNYVVSTNASAGDLKALMILGHIAVPYSGNFDQSSLPAPDGHPDHAGAWPADTYYGDIDGTWTDNITNVLGSRTQNKNNPGDGKWDQYQLPSALELQVGRVDFANMPAFTKTEVQLMRNYLNKDHQYKMDQLTVNHKVLIDDNFGKFSGEGFAADGYRLAPLVGKNNIDTGDFVTKLNTTSYQWGYGCGGGSFTSCSGVGTTASFTTNNVNAIFTVAFGSYFGDWDAQDDYLRAPMCSATPALTACWSGRPHWFFHHMALGENIGYAAITSQNNTTAYNNPVNIYAGFVHTALLGDPTLRTDYIKPPSAATLTSVTGGGAHLTWTASADGSVLGYYVYRSTDELGSYQKRSGIVTGTSYTDSFGTDGAYYYMVRPVKLQQTPSGSYYNVGLGSTSASANIDYPYADNIGTLTHIAQLSISVYPNPASDILYVSVNAQSASQARLRIMNQQGQVVHEMQASLLAGNNSITVQVGDMPTGLYYLSLNTDSDIYTAKWLKK